MKARVVKVLNHDKHHGVSAKNGKPYQIIQVQVELEDGSLKEADSFDTLVDNDVVDLTSKQNGDFTNWTASIPKTRPFAEKEPTNNQDVMLAVRMVYRQVVEINAKLDTLMGVEPPKQVTVAANEPAGDEPVEGTKKWDKWAKGDTPASRDEPPMEPPADLQSFMNGGTDDGA